MWKTSDSQTQVRYLERCISGNLWPKDLVIFESLTMHSGNIYNWAIKDKRVKKQLILSGHSKVVLSTSQLLGRSGRSMGGEDKEGNALSRCLMFCKSSSLRYWSFPLPLLLHLSEMLYGQFALWAVVVRLHCSSEDCTRLVSTYSGINMLLLPHCRAYNT